MNDKLRQLFHLASTFEEDTPEYQAILLDLVEIRDMMADLKDKVETTLNTYTH